MRFQWTMLAAVVAASAGALIVPAFAQDPDSAGSIPAQGMSMTMDRAGHGMTVRGTMPGNRMTGGCDGMMQSMAGGDGRPNSQWQPHRPDNATPD